MKYSTMWLTLCVAMLAGVANCAPIEIGFRPKLNVYDGFYFNVSFELPDMERELGVSSLTGPQVTRQNHPDMLIPFLTAVTVRGNRAHLEGLPCNDQKAHLILRYHNKGQTLQQTITLTPKRREFGKCVPRVLRVVQFQRGIKGRNRAQFVEGLLGLAKILEHPLDFIQVVQPAGNKGVSLHVLHQRQCMSSQEIQQGNVRPVKRMDRSDKPDNLNEIDFKGLFKTNETVSVVHPDSENSRDDDAKPVTVPSATTTTTPSTTTTTTPSTTTTTTPSTTTTTTPSTTTTTTPSTTTTTTPSTTTTTTTPSTTTTTTPSTTTTTTTRRTTTTTTTRRTTTSTTTPSTTTEKVDCKEPKQGALDDESMRLDEPEVNEVDSASKASMIIPIFIMISLVLTGSIVAYATIVKLDKKGTYVLRGKRRRIASVMRHVSLPLE